MPYVRNLKTNAVNLVSRDLWNTLKNSADRMNYKLELGEDMEVTAPQPPPGTFTSEAEFEAFLRGDGLEAYAKPIEVTNQAELVAAELLPPIIPKRGRGRPKKNIGV